MAALCVYRSYSYLVTGFFVSDEFGYFYNATHGEIYGDRWFFGWMNIFLFRSLGITGVNAFSYLLPFYMFFWAALTLLTFYKLVKLLGFDEVTTTLSLVSSFVVISFVVLSLGFLTEPVGLCTAMLGVYFMARYMKSKKAGGAVAFPILSASFFGFAAGTREPYDAFLISGMLIVLVLAFAKRKGALRAAGISPKTVLAVSVLAFVLPSLFFLIVPSQAYATQVAPISSQLASLISNPVTSGAGPTTTTVTSTVVNIVTTNSTTTTTSTVITTTSVLAGPAYPFYKQFVLTNMLLIFFGGIVLGWGPISFVFGVVGFVLLLRRTVRRRDLTVGFLFLFSLTALGSYLVVSFIYAPDPTYFSFQNYSTLIRFSDTALPAYFLMAPLVMSFIAKSRRRVGAMLAVFVAFILIAVPVYEVYAASNFGYTSSANPFQPGYRSDAVLIRNYFDSNSASLQAVNLVGLPYGWAFTPGVEDLHFIHPYSIGPSPLFPHLTQGNFTSARWPSFYLIVASSQSLPSNSSSMLQFVTQAPLGNLTASPGFTIAHTDAVLTGPDFTLYRIQLSWQ